MEFRFGGASVRVASTFRERLVGLLLPEGRTQALLLLRCRSVHTFGMRRHLDIAFIDGEGFVLAVHRDVPACRLLSEGRASCVLERFAAPSRAWLREGQKLGMMVVEGCTTQPKTANTRRREGEAHEELPDM